MTDKSFAVSFTVSKSPQEVFDAINDVSGWWSQEVVGNTTELGGEFDYHYRDVHRCKMRIIESVPGEKVSWLALENYFNFVEDQAEWKDTEVHFDISSNGDETTVNFSHRGLLPDHECYEICSTAWTGYVTTSLPNLILTGEGAPNPKE